MLIEFSVKNFRNFKEWFTFDLTTNRSYEFNKHSICEQHKVVRHGLIYGPNGGGKSNLGLAMLDLTCHLNDNWIMPTLKSNYLNAQSDNSTAEFVYKFQFDDTTVEYCYGKSDYSTLIYEKLIINQQLCIHIDRRESLLATFNLLGTENLKNDFSNSKISAIKYVSANAILGQDKITTAYTRFINFVDGMVFFRTLSRNAEHSGQSIDTKRLSHAIIEANKVSDFESFLNQAGVNCKLRVTGAQGDEIIEFVFDDKGIEFSQAASTGTMSLGMFYFWWMQLEAGELTFAFIDEFDAYYHFELSKLIVKKLSTVKCQTILTTHNTAIMSNDLLRPDCYFELKNKIINPLHNLTDRELRKAHNLEKMWRSGALSD